VNILKYPETVYIHSIGHGITTSTYYLLIKFLEILGTQIPNNVNSVGVITVKNRYHVFRFYGILPRGIIILQHNVIHSTIVLQKFA